MSLRCIDHCIELIAIEKLKFYQHSFRKRRSCESQLITTILDLIKDWTAASRSMLFCSQTSPLQSERKHTFMDWRLNSYLIDQLIDGEKSSPASVSSWSSSRNSHGTLLFLVYIKDLPGRARELNNQTVCRWLPDVSNHQQRRSCGTAAPDWPWLSSAVGTRIGNEIEPREMWGNTNY